MSGSDLCYKGAQNWTYCIINHVLIWALWLWHASNCYTSDEWYKQTNIEWCIPDGNNTLSGQLIPLLTTEMSSKTWQVPRIVARNAWYFLLQFAQKYHWALRIDSKNSFFEGKQHQISYREYYHQFYLRSLFNHISMSFLDRVWGWGVGSPGREFFSYQLPSTIHFHNSNRDNFWSSRSYIILLRVLTLTHNSKLYRYM